MRSNCFDMPYKAFLRLVVLSMPTTRWPERNCDSPNISVPYTQALSTVSSSCEDRSVTEVAPRGRRSSAFVRSRASVAASSS